MYGYDEVMEIETESARRQVEKDYPGDSVLQEHIIDRERESITENLDKTAPTGNENIDMMRRVLAYAKDEIGKGFSMIHWIKIPDAIWEDAEHFSDVSELKCGTTMCLAGTASLLSLGENEIMTSNALVLNKDEVENAEHDGVHASIRGREALGLNFDQAEILFFLEDDIDLVEAWMNYMAGEQLLPTD